MAELLDVQGLETQFRTREGVVHAVNGISFKLNEGETLGIVGESGCGKSVTVSSILQLIPSPPGQVVAGSAMYQGHDLLKMSQEEIRHVRGAQISMVFQDPMTSFNPVLTIGQQLAEPLEIHKGLTHKQALERVAEMINMVGIPNGRDRMNDYPHQFSGGMRQRAMIAMALTCNPQILIADEPTTALDVTIQAQITRPGQATCAMSWAWPSSGSPTTWASWPGPGRARQRHVRRVYIVERGVKELSTPNPSHPYTMAFWAAVPRIDVDLRAKG